MLIRICDWRVPYNMCICRMMKDEFPNQQPKPQNLTTVPQSLQKLPDIKPFAAGGGEDGWNLRIDDEPSAGGAP